MAKLGAMLERVVHLNSTCWITGRQVGARGSTKPVYAFKGIPYAKPPVRTLRFKPPQAVELWTGGRDGSQFGPHCPQDPAIMRMMHRPYKIPDKMSEDCLYLNIYTPSLEPAQKLPTMVWIHGGAFQYGLSDFYDGSALAAFHNVVVVTVNYRLGPFGFLSTGDDVVPGNMGFLDQLAALRWVKEHVQRFGGDADNVTAFGQSAGSIAISLHLVSPLARGLFHKAILQSGSCLFPGSTSSPQQARKALSRQLKDNGYDASHGDSNKMLDYLQGLSTDELLHQFSGTLLANVIDGQYLPEHPQILWDGGKSHDIPIVMGVTSHEGAFFMAQLVGSNKLTVPSYDMAQQLVSTLVHGLFYRGIPNADAVIDILMKTYFSLQDSQERLSQAMVALYGDILFVMASIKLSNIHSKKQKVWFYQFNKQLSVSPYPKWVKADHAHDVLYMFGAPWLHQFRDIFTPSEKEVSLNFMKLWTQFAHTGDPNMTGMLKWPGHQIEEPVHLVLDETPCLATRSRIMSDKIWQVYTETIPALLQSAQSHL